MASIPPIVRSMILCDDVVQRGTTSVIKHDQLGITTAIRPKPGEGFPLVHPELCVYVAMTGGSGTGQVAVVVVDADSEADVLSSAVHDYTHPADRHHLVGLAVRLRRCVFPRPGLYWVEFRYDGLTVKQVPLVVRL